MNVFESPYSIADAAGLEFESFSLLRDARMSFYKELKIPKGHRSGFRKVYDVADPLRDFHRKLAFWIGEYWTDIHDSVHGFRQGRSIVTNAKVHLNQDVIVKVDIENFFDSIQAAQVLSAFESIGASPDAAQWLTDMCTLEGRLPVGTRCSPIIANLVCRHLDVELEALCARYTRYADDITFSGETGVVPTLASIEGALVKHGFAVRHQSFFRVERSRPQYVTGLLVNHANGPHAPRAFKREARQVVYWIGKAGLDAHCAYKSILNPDLFISRVFGRLFHLRGVEAELGDRLLGELRSALTDSEDLPVCPAEA